MHLRSRYHRGSENSFVQRLHRTKEYKEAFNTWRLSKNGQADENDDVLVDDAEDCSTRSFLWRFVNERWPGFYKGAEEFRHYSAIETVLTQHNVWSGFTAVCNRNADFGLLIVVC